MIKYDDNYRCWLNHISNLNIPILIIHNVHIFLEISRKTLFHPKQFNTMLNVPVKIGKSFNKTQSSGSFQTSFNKKEEVVLVLLYESGHS